jgi:sporulation protein YlmC with PRC-barrel domain
MRPVTANVLSTAEVRSPAGEDVGKVVDFMLDTERGSVVYAVLAVGGVLGVGAKMLAIPPQALKLEGERRLALAVDTATLDAAPGIDRANAPETADASLRARTRASRPHPASRT